MRKIESALISVFDKEGLDPIVEYLAVQGVKIYSTGGTLKHVESLGVEATPVEELTSYPSIFDGRVKTLHPAIFGGILARRDNEKDQKQMKEYNVPSIDLVIVDLYPFEETVASGADHQSIIEKIDVGGISLIRAAAKNYNDVTVISSKEQYGDLMELLNKQECSTSLEQRELFATKAFMISSGYDAAIFNFFNDKAKLPALKISHNNGQELRYGENPHQKAFFYGDLYQMFDKLNGKEISYNNMLDIDAAVNLMAEFEAETPAFAILKHNNACGVAVRPTLLDAWKSALSGDPVSAFGGVLICNCNVDPQTATEIDKLFFEVIIAPQYDIKALEILQGKKNRIILVQKEKLSSSTQLRTMLNGVAVQQRDLKLGGRETDLKVVTKRAITDEQSADLLFANAIVKHSKSNAIVLAKEGVLLGSGMGQTSRVDALRHAIKKAKSFGFDLKGAAMASDAFFPFPDCVEIAHKEGIITVIQPGGSVRDQESIAYCDQNQMAMAFTSLRHFKH